jgi:hypothetical protein
VEEAPLWKGCDEPPRPLLAVGYSAVISPRRRLQSMTTASALWSDDRVPQDKESVVRCCLKVAFRQFYFETRPLACLSSPMRLALLTSASASIP